MTRDPGRDEPELISLAEAAGLLRISVSTAKKLAASGRLPGVLPKVGALWRVNKAVLTAFTSAGSETAAESEAERRATTLDAEVKVVDAAARRLAGALAAVRELHSSRTFVADGEPWSVCVECRQSWPCETAQVITF